ncbi:MAG: tetratricopeptide repeat protein [Proteobacteria bacterium]|nr:tetratricopeptide repeat protein [Pseudomonadota bacterium]
MKRLVIYMVIILAISISLAWWADHPGAVTISWLGHDIYTSFAVLFFMVALLLAFGLVIQSLWNWAKRELPVVGENKHLRRQERGLEILNKAVVALAAGDGVNARKLALKASKMLPPQPMMHVVAAQAAKLSGDKEAAEKEFRDLLKNPEAAFLGVRGLLVAAVAEGKGREARRLAEKAKEINPKSAWAIKTLFDLQVKATDWEEAEATLEDGKRSRVFTREEKNKLLATLNYCRAKEAELGNEWDRATTLVQKALRTRKDFLPAVLMSVRLDLDAGKKRRALRTLEGAWALTPHPDIAGAYKFIEADEPAVARYRRLQKLARANPKHIESHLMLADLALGAGKNAGAQKHLDEALAKSSRARVFQLQADLEDARGGSQSKIKDWTDKAENGMPEPLWQCSNCGAEMEHWALHCPTCRMFNTLDWRSTEPHEIKLREAEQQDFLTMLPNPLQDNSVYSRKSPDQKK